MTARTQNGGLARITTLLIAAQWYLQWGTGTGAAATANVVTTTTTTEARTLAVATQGTTTVTNDKKILTGTITALGSRTITEVGVFDAAGTGSPPTGGNMDEYFDFTGIPLSTGDAITFTLNMTYQ